MKTELYVAMILEDDHTWELWIAPPGDYPPLNNGFCLAVDIDQHECIRKAMVTLHELTLRMSPNFEGIPVVSSPEEAR
jgi:hypothetical protein